MKKISNFEKLSCVDLFCGCGGMSLGFQKAGFEAFAKQCGNFTKTICGICHDRFIIADQKEIYWSGASLKDAGRLTFAAAKLSAEMIPGLLASVRKATSATNSYKKGGFVK